MKHFISKYPKTFLAIVSLPITILGTNLTDVKSEESTGLYFTGNIGTSSFTSADWKAEVNGLAYKGDLKFDDGTGWELGLGYDFGRLRTEISYANSKNEESKKTCLGTLSKADNTQEFLIPLLLSK